MDKIDKLISDLYKGIGKNAEKSKKLSKKGFFDESIKLLDKNLCILEIINKLNKIKYE